MCLFTANTQVLTQHIQSESLFCQPSFERSYHIFLTSIWWKEPCSHIKWFLYF